jgi:SAM-dependent methyltransferase
LVKVHINHDNLVTKVRSRYNVGPQFARAYLDYWHLGFSQPFERLEDILNLPAPQSVWFNFALTANKRGQQTARFVAQHIPDRVSDAKPRYLDIGSGYGGSLVAFSKLGFEVQGIDINDQLIGLANANLQDHNLTDCNHKMSILEDGLAERLGTFDVITLLAVIEHVADVPQTLYNAVRLLNPGGILMLDIPNKYSLTFVAHDPHYNLFGLMLYEHDRALEFFHHYYSLDYDVGEFYPLEYYKTKLCELGCEARMIPSPMGRIGKFYSTPLRLADALFSDLSFLLKGSQPLPPAMRKETQARFGRYLIETGKDLFRLPLKAALETSFQVKYLTSIWTLVAQKK